MNYQNTLSRIIQISWGTIAVILILLTIGLHNVEADSLFYPAVNYYAGDGPKSVAIGDLNGDSNQDIAVANWGGIVSVLLGNGDGTFQNAVQVHYHQGGAPNVSIGDLNGDNKLDLAVAGGFDVSVLLGNGDGTFQSAMNYPVPQCIYGSLKSVSIGDLNGDADQDIVVAKYCHFGGNVLVMLGNGDGTFQNAVDYEANPWPIFVAIGDLNGDGDLDLVVRNGHAYGGQDCPVSVLLGNGDGTFQNAVSYSAGYYSGSVAIGDLNKDSNLDLAVANDASENVSVMLGNGDGAFLSTVNYQGGGFDVAIDDLNGDNNLDLAVANGDGVWVLLGNGDGSFQGAVNYNAGDGPSSSVAIGDLNEDNDLDLVVAKGENDNISILINTGFLPVLEISIDIKPDSYPNSINFKSKGKVSVAILTTDDFDAYDVDPVTCEFAGAYPLRWNMEDVDHDGDHDMLLHFKTRELVDLDLDSTEATLYGETYGGVQIIGTDSVNIVPKGNMHSKKAKK